jgi:hypothetical protein
LTRLTYRKVVKPAAAIAAATRPIVRGDQNPASSIKGLLVGPPQFGVSSGVSVGVSSGEGEGDDACVTVNVFVATPPVVLVTVTVYVPGDTSGTKKSMLKVLYIDVFIVLTLVVPNVTLNVVGALKPAITVKTVVPGEPWEGFRVTDKVSAFATGGMVATRLSMHRKSKLIFALPRLFSMAMKSFCIKLSSPDDVAFSQI